MGVRESPREIEETMNNKERVYAAFDGKRVDRPPVTSIYNFLYHQDHFSELTGLPHWRMHEWLANSPDKHADLFLQLHRQAPFELLQPQQAASRVWRERQEFIERDGKAWRHDRLTGEQTRIDVPAVSGHASDGQANEIRRVFTREDIRSQVKVYSADSRLAEGANDYLDAIVARYGSEEFILSGGVVGTFYSCHGHVGLTNLFALLIEEPSLIEELSRRILDQNIEEIRRLAMGIGDAIYIDDATATSDMISVQHYERFSLPYMQAMVKEIQRLGHKAILIYFGGIADRLQQISSLGADGIVFEASMKGFTNDVADITAKIGGRITVFGNVDPVRTLQDADDAALEKEIRRQVEAGRPGRGFILSTASPITPRTPLRRVQRYIALGIKSGRSALRDKS